MSISSGELNFGAAALSGRAPQRIHYFGALSPALAAYGYPQLRQQAHFLSAAFRAANIA
ncbi:hypothetical protein [Bradyrhizobium sp. WSM2793]|uniref:hypothetical protein n=1 Tax=Bradyrhizobium sp. WSM2793 TaxID=1038866 RepID=UPI0003A29036|nr:hypothetical protein [Bradyrhizobium sp. WSM2793]